MTIEIAQDLLPVEEKAAKQQLGELLGFARGLIVRDEGAFKTITEVYAQARDMEKLVLARLKEANRPYQEQINANKDTAENFLQPLKEIVAVCNNQTNHYRQMLIEEKKREEDSIKAAAAAFDAPVPYIAPVERTIRGTGARSVTRKHTRWEVVDIAKVPARYLQVNEEAVLSDVRLGIGAIAGLRIWEETTTELRAR